MPVGRRSVPPVILTVPQKAEQLAKKRKAADIGRLILAALIVLGGLGYVVRHSLLPTDHAAQTAVEMLASAATRVTVVTAEPQTISRRLEAGGAPVPRQEELIYSEVIGAPIEKGMVDLGDQLTEGQALAVLGDQRQELFLQQNAADVARAEPPVAQAQAQSREAATAVEEARVLRERGRTLREGGKISEQVLEDRHAAAASAEARLEAQEQALCAARADLQRATAERDELVWQQEELIVQASTVTTERNTKVGQTTGAHGGPQTARTKWNLPSLR